MQDRIGSRQDALGSQQTRGGAKQGQQFGRASTLILMGLQDGMAFELPRGPRLRDGLIGSSFIFVQLHNAGRFRLLVR